MIATLIIALLTFAGVIVSITVFPHLKIGKVSLDTFWILPLLAAIILLSTSLAPFNEVVSSLTSDSSINPIKILILFFSMTVISIYLDQLGLFHYLANLAAKKGGSSQYALFFILYALVSALTIFTSNDVVILTFTPFICFFSKRAKINPLPYLIAEFAAANAGIVQLGIIFLIFFRKLKTPIEVENEDYHIESKIDLVFGVVILLGVLITLIISNYIAIEMYLISMVGALSLLLISLIIRLITKKNWNYLGGSLKRLPYQLIPFVLSMFVIVIALSYQGITSYISDALNKDGLIWIYGASSFASANIINNIPMSILFSNLVSGLDGISFYQATYASIIGSNIGAFFTPIGALAGIMFSSLLNKHDIKFSFLDFTKYGIVIALPTLAISLAILLVIL